MAKWWICFNTVLRSTNVLKSCYQNYDVCNYVLTQYSICIKWFVHQDLTYSKCFLVGGNKCLAELWEYDSQHKHILLTVFGWVTFLWNWYITIPLDYGPPRIQAVYEIKCSDLCHFTSWTINILHYILIHCIPVEVFSCQCQGVLHFLSKGSLAQSFLWHLLDTYLLLNPEEVYEVILSTSILYTVGRTNWWYSASLELYNWWNSPHFNRCLSNCKRYLQPWIGCWQ